MIAERKSLTNVDEQLGYGRYAKHLVEHHGGMGIDTYVDIVNGNIAITGSYEYNYEQPGYTDDKAAISVPVNVYNVHDLGGL